MPQLLLELLCEEIPARMQKRAEEDLARALSEKLKAHGLAAETIATFSTPRRLGAVIDDLPAKAADVREERKGPRVGAPEAAVQGFLKGAGLASIDQAQIVEDKKGGFYVAMIERAGRATGAIVQEIVPEIIRGFPWPKSMRSQSGDLQWVRPLHNVLCLFDGAPIACAPDGVLSLSTTRGHRFHAPGAIAPSDFADYKAKLFAAKVEIDREARKAKILRDARQACAAQGLELVDDAGLLEEVAGLVEWPVVLLGDMDPAFLDLPGEVIRLSMRTHQKYFAVRDPKKGALAPHFVVVANIEAKDGGSAIAAGNARVLSARLNDARYFWDVDRYYDALERKRAKKLDDEERIAKLQQIVFHQKLGSVWEKAERASKLAETLCAVTGADKALVKRAARLMKCDLVTEVVGEFPELQGQIGRALAEAQGEHDSVCAAIEDHYRPQGPNDRAPNDSVAVTLALADKLDTLVGFWAIDEKPTGSSDPYALRRAALGVVRIVLDRELRFSLSGALEAAAARSPKALTGPIQEQRRSGSVDDLFFPDLVRFLADRLKVQLREQGKRHDLVDAVFALGDDDLVRIVARVEALDGFLKTEDGANLLAGYRRAANILAAEEKKGKGLAPADAARPVDESLLSEAAEKALHGALMAAAPAAKAAAEKEDFVGAMAALARLRGPVDAFFEAVHVNAEDAALRRNRLKLLLDIRDALHAVADFSRIEN